MTTELLFRSRVDRVIRAFQSELETLDHDCAEQVYARLLRTAKEGGGLITEDQARIMGECLAPAFCYGTATMQDALVRRMLMITSNPRFWFEKRARFYGEEAQQDLNLWITARLFCMLGRPEGDQEVSERSFLIQACEMFAMILLRPSDVRMLPAPNWGHF